MLLKCYAMWLCLVLLVLSLAEPGSRAFAESGAPIADRALGRLVIPRLSVGTLFQLKGLKGDGFYLTRDEGDRLCRTEVSLVAGSFNGRALGIHSAGEVVIDVYSPLVSQRLLTHQEIVSEDYQVVSRSYSKADMVIRHGLEADAGFILHPQPRWLSWWRYEEPRVDCTPVSGRD